MYGGKKKKQPVWEITGAEFTNQGVHTAEGISIRFPRVTRIRRDKDWSTATTLNELRELFKKKPDSVDFGLLLGASTSTASTTNTCEPSKRAISVSPKKCEISKEETSLLNEPKKKSQAPLKGMLRKRKDDEYGESSENHAIQQGSGRKRQKMMKRESKQETGRSKHDDNSVGGVDVMEHLPSSSDSDDEDYVSNDALVTCTKSHEIFHFLSLV